MSNISRSQPQFKLLPALLMMVGWLLCHGAALAQGTIKVAFVAPFSGPTAAQGDAYLKMLKFAMDRTNARGNVLGKKFELVTFDDKGQPSEALIALKSVTDQNIPIVIQGIGSNIGAAMLEGVSKHNARNPNNRVLYLNSSSQADDMTEEKCDFWHFRFVANVGMRVAAMVKNLPKDVKTVYLMNQDYVYGQGIQAQTKKFLAQYRPDIKIVGDEMIPLQRVKDFSSHVAKVKASGAQVLVTSTWGADFVLMMKAGNEAGLNVQYYSFGAFVNGSPTAMGDGGLNRVVAVLDSNDNIGAENKNASSEEFVKAWRATDTGLDYSWIQFQVLWDMLGVAINKAGSTDPLKVALALEGLQVPNIHGEPTIMRADDHQLLQPLYAAVFTKPVKYDSEKTGLGWKTLSKASTQELTLPTVCKMKRPS